MHEKENNLLGVDRRSGSRRRIHAQLEISCYIHTTLVIQDPGLVLP